MIRPSQGIRGLLGGVLLLGAGALSAATAAEPSMDVQSEIQALKAEVARLRAKDDESWLTERRAEEVKALIRDVLSDADTRASLAEGGVTAGHDGKHFYLASEDGNFLLQLEGQFQMRYVYNRRSNPGSTTTTSVEDVGGVPTVVSTTTLNDAEQSGFLLRRSKVKFGGHIFGDIGYKLVLNAVRDDGGEELEEAWVSFKVFDGAKLIAGRIKAPFQRENLISSSKQLAVDRSSVQEVFRIDWTQGVMLDWKNDMFRLRGSIDQGRRQFSDFYADGVDYAMTGRADVLLAGDWKQTEDFIAWSDQAQSLSAGAAVHYEVGETGTSAANSSFLGWTVDGLYKNQGLTLYLAGYGRHSESGASPSISMDDYGLEAMIGYMIIPDTLEPFFRYGRIMMDDARTSGTTDSSDINEFTVGINWFQHKHASKLTVDMTYFDEPMHNSFLSSGYSNGLGLQRDAEGDGGQFAIRAQYQLLF